MTGNDTAFTLRTLTDEDWADVVDVDSHAFGMTVEKAVVEADRELHEPGRSIGAYDGSTLAGIAAAYSFDLSVPGAMAPAAGVSWVGVLPTHRRRGVLRALMTHQLTEIHQRGREALAILWASEPQIYGRFGYGLASHALSMTVPRDPDALRADAPRDEGLRLRLVGVEDWKRVADLYDAVTRTRPGMIARNDGWHRRAARDEPVLRRGRSALRCVVAEDDRAVRGYARYSTKPDWSPAGPRGKVHVREIIAGDSAARAALYRYLFDLDLMATTELENLPVDDPLLHWLGNLRAAAPTLGDALYVRLVDLPTALSQRTYSSPVDVVLDVSDELCPWNAGRWRLRCGTDGAQCNRTEDDADLAVSIAELGALYLGGTSLAALDEAGRVQVRRPGALGPVSAAFSAGPAPWCPFVF